MLQCVKDIYHLGGYSLDEIIEFRSTVDPITMEMTSFWRTQEDLKNMENNLLSAKKTI